MTSHFVCSHKFHFNPKKYGYINLSQFQYTSSNGVYALGLVLEKAPAESMRHSIYTVVEQSVLKINRQQIGLIGQFGYAPKKDNYCYAYYGAGVIVEDIFQKGGRDDLGFIVFRANTVSGSETAMELTYKYTVNSYISIQPALHYIHDKHSDALIGLIRGVFTIGG